MAARHFTRPANPALLLLLMLMLVCAVSAAKEPEPFEVVRAEFNLDDSLLLLDLVVKSEIPDYISIALDQGFSVPMMFEVEILATKRYWFDEPIV